MDLARLQATRLITVKDGRGGGRGGVSADYSELPDAAGRATAVPRVALIGAGLGATQVIDILADRDPAAAGRDRRRQPRKWASR